MGRALTPEILDFLAPDDPRAIHSRADLARINAVMGQSAIMAKALPRFPAPKLLADLGAGDQRRSKLALMGYGLVGALGANDVNRHDALASVQAGFRAKELSGLWPQDDTWICHEAAAFPFTHVFDAHAL